MADPCHRIVVKDELGSSYDAAFDGMGLERSNGETAIVGPVANAATVTPATTSRRAVRGR